MQAAHLKDLHLLFACLWMSILFFKGFVLIILPAILSVLACDCLLAFYYFALYYYWG